MKTLKITLIASMALIVSLAACGGMEPTIPVEAKPRVGGKADGPVDKNLTCQGNCGSLVWGATGYCGCDDLCGQYGDCCYDKELFCDTQTDAGTPPVCNSLDEQQCNTREDCVWVWENGFPGPIGVCKEITIGNECWGAWLDQSGNCRGPADGVLPDTCCVGQFCGGIAGIPCPQGMFCELDGDYPDAGGTCVMCQPVLCKLYCPNGFVLDENGCETCECKPNNCLQEGCAEGKYCTFCWTDYMCIPEGAVC